MSKPFFEAFPTLRLNSTAQSLFEEIEVTKISSTRARDFIRIYIYSLRLIEKKIIYSVEEAIRE